MLNLRADIGVWLKQSSALLDNQRCNRLDGEVAQLLANAGLSKVDLVASDCYAIRQQLIFDVRHLMQRGRM